ncbi:Cys-tRNA(Pro) deacylase [Colwellia sp. MEBiC06753]
MTPAVTFADKLKLTYNLLEYHHDANAPSFGLEAVEKLNLPAEAVFKTLVVALDTGALAVAVVPVAHQLNLKNLAKAAKAKKAKMAEQALVERTTGYVLGGVSPLGQKKKLATFIDNSAQALDKIYVSAGRRGLEIELTPADLIQATQGKFAAIAAE